jgi:hypothetical protein
MLKLQHLEVGWPVSHGPLAPLPLMTKALLVLCAVIASGCTGGNGTGGTKGTSGTEGDWL